MDTLEKLFLYAFLRLAEIGKIQPKSNEKVVMKSARLAPDVILEYAKYRGYRGDSTFASVGRFLIEIDQIPVLENDGTWNFERKFDLLNFYKR